LKSPLYGDVSEKPMMKMLDPFSAGTLTSVRTIQTFVENILATVFKQSTVADCFFFFW
jgi:hypothetical protein